jgi:hypothetical protein
MTDAGSVPADGQLRQLLADLENEPEDGEETWRVLQDVRTPGV